MNDLLSVSRVQEWLSCRYRWGLRYENHLSPKIMEVPAMTVGQVVHLGVAAGIRAWERYHTADAAGRACTRAIDRWYKEHEPSTDDDDMSINSLNDDLFDVFGDLATMSKNIALRTLVFIDLPRWETVRLKGQLLIEKQMVVPLGVPGWRGFQSYFDWVAKDLETGMVWLIDHKVRKTFLNDESEETSLQGAVYQRVLLNHGIEAVGTRIIQIKAQLPVAPKVNKDGTVSRSSVATDWDTYAATVVAAGHNPLDYEDMRFKLSQTEWHRWISAYRSRTEADAVWDDVVIPVAKEIVKTTRARNTAKRNAVLGLRSDPPVLVRNMSFFSCMRCWAKSICLAELRGQDVDWIKENEYALDTRSQMVYNPGMEVPS